jgi:hypothetical protein
MGNVAQINSSYVGKCKLLLLGRIAIFELRKPDRAYM